MLVIKNRLLTKEDRWTTTRPIAAGLAVVASDTGRVLMIQRPLDDGDPNGGKWEFPGGVREDNEEPRAAAVREWQEETGLPLPSSRGTYASWVSGNGKYVGFVLRTPNEEALDLSKRDPFSDPDSEVGGVIAWVHPRDLPQHNLRPALLSDIDEVMARVTKWLLGQVLKSGLINRLMTKEGGTCKPGQRADLTDCTPASGEGGKKPKTTESAEKPKRAAPGSQLEESTRTKLRESGMVGTFPPANVPMSAIKINPNPDKFSALMQWDQKTASGRISRQYRYTQDFHDRNAAEKFDRVLAVEPYLEEIGKGLVTRMQDKSISQRDREAAAIANAIKETGLRPTDGNESVAHGHFGISSLQARHVKIVGDEVRLDFIGKEGVRNRTVIRDPVNVAFFQEALAGKSGKDFLFEKATAADAGDVLKELSKAAGGPEGIKVKDLRTIKATQTARQVVGAFEGPPPPLHGDAKKDAKLIAKAVLEMSGKVAKVLNNTPTQARDNYIHPEVWKGWMKKLADMPVPKKKPVKPKSLLIQKGDSEELSKLQKRRLEMIDRLVGMPYSSERARLENDLRDLGRRIQKLADKLAGIKLPKPPNLFDLPKPPTH